MAGYALAQSAFRHLQMQIDDVRLALCLVIDVVAVDDIFAVALTCSDFRAATILRGGAFARFPQGVRTKRRAMLFVVLMLSEASATRGRSGRIGR